MVADILHYTRQARERKKEAVGNRWPRVGAGSIRSTPLRKASSQLGGSASGLSLLRFVMGTSLSDKPCWMSCSSWALWASHNRLAKQTAGTRAGQEKSGTLAAGNLKSEVRKQMALGGALHGYMGCMGRWGKLKR